MNRGAPSADEAVPKTVLGTVWVVPNRNTVGLCALIVAMWYAGASQSNGAAYLLCFTLTGVALVSMVHTWANLRGLHLQAGAIRSAFAGEELRVPLLVRSRLRRRHMAVRVGATKARLITRIPALEPLSIEPVELSVEARRRGRFALLNLRITSLFPLGFFTARCSARVHHTHFIYPAPEGPLPLPRSLGPAPHQRSGLRVEGDDFSGVRSYQQGESQRHIDWKASARGQPLLIKQWSAEADETVHLDWSKVAHLGYEPALSQLARWIVMAERRGASYALRLPDRSLPADHGSAHYHECLRALAEQPQEEEKA